MSQLVILRAPRGTTDLNHGTDWFTPDPDDRLFAVTPDRVPYFVGGPCGCVIVDPDEARSIVLERQRRELAQLGLV